MHRSLFLYPKSPIIYCFAFKLKKKISPFYESTLYTFFSSCNWKKYFIINKINQKHISIKYFTLAILWQKYNFNVYSETYLLFMYIFRGRIKSLYENIIHFYDFNMRFLGEKLRFCGCYYTEKTFQLHGVKLRMRARGKERKIILKKGLTWDWPTWVKLAIDQYTIRELLKRYPSGLDRHLMTTRNKIADVYLRNEITMSVYTWLVDKKTFDVTRYDTYENHINKKLIYILKIIYNTIFISV